ncbi:DUF2786 domain-containing protein [Vibrio alginolyticus]|uniref:DUF2786 domain-containing protein n=1 Tax=Vibrio alginolyticus TaxID=663 RepID=UPI0006CA682D|nr:DUF2786 domain-containing protein [Vibrio alginolyticus]KPM97486.1 hypothetical protein AOG25_13520 [Vibrio alginolyticus]CAH7188872.1 conserved hypothetical protein [Vibrio chagasii]CAH7357560.1 conserved hypothetical protein [Vibrio chagasii]
MSDKEKALERIEKCLKLAESGNEHEARQAMAMAKKLMLKYGFVPDDIDFVSIAEVSANTRVAKTPPSYMQILLVGIATLFKCKVINKTERRVVHNSKLKTRNYSVVGVSYPVFIGERSQAMLAAYCFDVVVERLAQARKDFISTLHGNCKKSRRVAEADTYCEYWVSGVCKSIDMTFSNQEEEQFERYFEYRERKGKTKITEARSGREADENKFNKGASRGYEDGLKEKLHVPVDGSEQEAALIS